MRPILVLLTALAVACDASGNDSPADQVEFRFNPLDDPPTTDKAKVDATEAAILLGDCINPGELALLSIQVLAGPDVHDRWRYRFTVESAAHHDDVACLRDRVISEANP